MKHLLSVLFILGIVFVSCQKEYDPLGTLNLPTNPAAAGTFRAKIDGVQWEANTVKQAQREAGVIVIAGMSSGKSLVMRVADSGVHKYSFHSESLSNAAAWTDSSSGSPAAFVTNQWPTVGTYGELNITAIDTVKKTMSGTFSLKVYRSLDSMQRTFTEGVFQNVPYATQSPAPATTDTFRVKINGTSFSYNLLAGVKTFGMIAIVASQSTAPSVGITMPESTVAGTYDFDAFTYIGQYNASSTQFFAADSGKVTILEHNPTTKRIRGNFNFRAAQPFTSQPPIHYLTEGYFSVKYQ